MDEVVSPPGDQRNVPPEVDGSAVITALEPEQMEGLFTVTVDEDVTVISCVVVLQPIVLHACKVTV